MDIIFDKKPGEVFDFFRSLWFMNNHELIMKLKIDYGIEEMNGFEKAIINTMDNLDKDEIKKYFYMEMKPEYFTGMKSIWEYPTLETYFNYIKSLDEYGLITHADQAVQLIYKSMYEVETNEEELFEDTEVAKQNIQNLIINLDISAGLKWELSQYINNPKEYLKKLGKVIYTYIPFYKKITHKREEVLKKYNEELEEGLNNQGIEYLIDETGYTYDFSKFKKIKVSTTALMSLQIYSEGKICYVLIGPSIRKVVSNRKNEDIIEKNLNFINGISEPTRYKILQLLSEKNAMDKRLQIF